jgi:DNA-3-methyladenine glycosylase I
VTDELVKGDLLDRGEDGVLRCFWGAAPEEYRRYHDLEWGRPVHDDQRLFEKICLEGFQSGLSWLTILRKRDAFRAGFADFDVQAVAAFDDDDVERLVQDTGIVRHRGKITSTINNARQCAQLQGTGESLDGLVWSYRPSSRSRPKRVTRQWLMDNPTCAESAALSKELKRRGWSFVGPTTMYAFMQSVGIVDDHQAACHVRTALDG